mmetsp:Transcript_114757/g.161149  ORF Transcript_114757/g.161149 Transcript_114757/m.161149 type:complete len:120 (-) Transcript_114757:221-580(-)
MNEIWAILWLGTFIYWAVGIFFLIWNLLPIPPNFSDKGLVGTCIVAATFCTWFFWFLIYLSQMYPLPGVAPQILWPEGMDQDYYFPEGYDYDCQKWHNETNVPGCPGTYTSSFASIYNN